MTSDFAFHSADGVHELTARVWGCGDPAAVIQVVYGMKEHLGRYEAFAEAFNARGFAVCAHEQLGHGLSARTPDELGFFGARNGGGLLVEDVSRMNAEVRRRFPGLPVILYGHSMGSLIARAYLARYGGAVDGAVISGTLGPDPTSAVGLALCTAIAAANGPAHRSRFLEKMAFNGYTARIPDPRTQNDWLTRDAAVVDAYRDDPYCAYRFTAGGFRDIAALRRKVSSRALARSMRPGTPILIVSGEMDPCGAYGKGVRAVDAQLRRSGVRDVTLRLYPDARHEMHNEINREELFDDVAEWVRARAGARV